MVFPCWIVRPEDRNDLSFLEILYISGSDNISDIFEHIIDNEQITFPECTDVASERVLTQGPSTGCFSRYQQSCE